MGNRSNVVGSSDLGYGALRENLEAAWTRSQPMTGWQSSSAAPSRSIPEQEHRDGEDVLAILGDPSETNALFEPPEEDDENYDWGLSAEQLTQLRVMTKELFSAPELHASMSPEHPLNMVPAFAQADEKNNGLHIHAELSVSLGSQHVTIAAREIWMAQWNGVLTRYTDEVWGGLLPLVKEARREVEDLRSDPSGTDQPKALRRLGAILGHLQRS